jgi:hypothetical protein
MLSWAQRLAAPARRPHIDGIPDLTKITIQTIIRKDTTLRTEFTITKR